MLPPLRLALAATVIALAFPAPEAAAQTDAAQADAALAAVTVIGTTPVGGTGLTLPRYAGNAQVLRGDVLGVDARGLASLLDQSIGSVTLNDTQGNAWQADLAYRGFTASPVLGTPQGVSVFMDGVRLNESFGDVVAWDLIPRIALESVTLVPGSNPMYGLNTLGGAVVLATRSPFGRSGGSVAATTGSFGRFNLDADLAGHDERWGAYVAVSSHDDNGWARYNPSHLRQLLAKLGYRDGPAEAELSVNYANNRLFGNQMVPVSMMAHAAGGYTHPDSTTTEAFTVNLRGTLDLDDRQVLTGNIAWRHIVRDILNSNLAQPLADGSNPATNDPTCVGTATCPAANLLAHVRQDTLGGNLQWSGDGPLERERQVVALGLNVEAGRTTFSNRGQAAIVDPSNATVGVADYVSQAGLSANTRRAALYGTTTLDPWPSVSLTASARLDHARVQLAGTSCSDADALCTNAAVVSPLPGSNTLADVGGEHRYQRINPALGLTWRPLDGLTSYANYSEGFRTPSAIELACADPNAPCTGIPNAFGADPALRAVVSRTLEVGARGGSSRALWRLAAFRATLQDDILFNQTNAVQGYFANVGQTLRQGLEASLQGRGERWDYTLAGSWVDARYRTAFTIANAANSECIAANGAGAGCAGVTAQPGDRIPGIAAFTAKLRLGYSPLPATRIGLSLAAQGSQYARGDENNRDTHGQVPGFATASLDLRHALTPSMAVFGGVSNLFNRSYATAGLLAANNLGDGSAEQFRAMGAPRALHAGVRFTF